MTWTEARLSLQLIAEERTGAAARERAYRNRAEEDAKWAAATGQVTH